MITIYLGFGADSMTFTVMFYNHLAARVRNDISLFKKKHRCFVRGIDVIFFDIKSQFATSCIIQFRITKQINNVIKSCYVNSLRLLK